jgi:hypothetical protein
MIEEIKQHVTFLRTGDRLLPGVAAKFATFHRWTLEQLKAETTWKPSSETRKRVGKSGKLIDTKDLLPPTVDRTPRYMAIERLLVLLATIPRLEPAERRARANEITEACDYLEAVGGRQDDAETAIRRQALQLWNDGKMTWADIAEKQGRPRGERRAIASEIGRFARKYKLFIRKDTTRQKQK